MIASSWLVVAVPGSARADGDDWQITRYTVTATPEAKGGTTTVTLDFDFDFGDEAGHGPFLVLPEQVPVPDNPDVWRDLKTTIVSVTSSTGANTTQDLSHEDGQLVVRIGDEDVEVTGVQKYQVKYTVHGILQPNDPTSRLDEFNWNAIGLGWQVPISNISVTVNAPVAATRTACWQGDDYKTECPAPKPATSMKWALDQLAPGEGLQVVAGFPVGTFTDAAYTTSKRYHAGNVLTVDPATVGATGALGLAAIVWVVSLVRRRGSDRAWAGITPGTIPATKEEMAHAQVVRRPKTEVTVAFTPPKGTRPGEIGTLIDASADDADVTATIIDLAVRKYIQLEPHDKKQLTMTMLTHEHPGKLTDYERNLMANLFPAGATQLTTSDLAGKEFATVLETGKSDLDKRVSAKPLQWFSDNPRYARLKWVGRGVVLIGLGILLALALGYLFGWGLPPLALVVAGVVMIVMSGSASARTPMGSAVYEQARGFELYLKTAEADQIKFEEGIDVFSRYLPYAIAFGVAHRWVKIFQDLAEQGRYQPDLGWYGGTSPYTWGYLASSPSFDGLTSSMHSAVQAASASTGGSGGSGFSGGGGVGGGGGGGW